MKRKTYCVYNATRECFLSLNVKAADTMLSRLRGFIGRFRLRSDEGIWVIPSRGVHTLGLFFPLDLIYLDENYRVIVLELPTHTIYSSHTQPGDQLVVCLADELPQKLASLKPATITNAKG